MTKARIFLVILLFAALVMASHSPILSNGFISFDDSTYIYGNRMVQQGFTLETIKWAFTSVVVANWHPVTMLSHLLDGQLFGLNPAGHHAMSLLLHTANALLLALVLFRLTGAFHRSIAAAALFAVHPIHVESIAWASERKDLLSFGFAMLTILAYKHWLDTQKQLGWKHLRALASYALLLTFFALALLSKPTAVTIPPLLLLLDFWPLQRFPAQSFLPAVKAYLRALPALILEKLPLLALSAIGSFVVFMVQRESAVVEAAGLPVAPRILNAFVAYARYLLKLLIPYDLTLLYPHPTWWPIPVVIASILLLAALTFAIFWAASRYDKRYLPVAWLWFLGVMIPMIGIVQVGEQSMADRYAYLTFPGLYILIVWGAADLLSRFKSPAVAPSLLVCALVPLAIVSNVQSRFWRDSQTIYARALQVTSANALAMTLFGSELLKQNRPVDALPYFQNATQCSPSYAEAWRNLGNTLNVLGRITEAQHAYEKALSADPNLISVRASIALIYNHQGQSAQAQAVLTKLIEDHPESPEPYYALGRFAAERNQLAQALEFFDAAIARAPDYAQVYNSRGTVKARMGNIPAAYEDFLRAVQLNPDLIDAQENLKKAQSVLQPNPAR